MDELLVLLGLMYQAGLQLHIYKAVRFDDASTCQEWRKLDNLSPSFEEFSSNYKDTYTSSQYLTIDAKLDTFRSRCFVRQYIPNEPAKYGIKIYDLVDAKNHYTVNLEIYSGRPRDEQFLQRNEDFDVLNGLVQPISESNRNVTFDNWFTLKTH